MDLKILIQTVSQIAEEKGIDEGRVIEAIEGALAAAYKKENDMRAFNVKAKMDKDSGEVAFTQVKEVVDNSTVQMVSEEDEESDSEEAVSQETSSEEDTEASLPRYNPDRHILIDEARKIKPDVELHDEIEFPIEDAGVDFGRIAAQTAKQVVLQKLREAERDSIVEEFKDKEGDIVSGVVQRFERGNVFIDLGRTTGIMFSNESIPGEHYRTGERLRFYVVGVQSESRTPGIILSRAHPNFVKKLFELEIPEIADGIVEIKAIAREPGSRTKIAVQSTVDGVDPVGSCVGQRGTRIMAITNELGQEKLDVVEWSEDPEVFITNALNPAKIKEVEIIDSREVRVLVAEDQLSLAIGKGGQNVRLAAKLSGWKIDVRSQTRPDETLDGGVAELDDSGEIIEDTSSDTPVEEEEKPIYHKPEEEDDLEEAVTEDVEETEIEEDKGTLEDTVEESEEDPEEVEPTPVEESTEEEKDKK